MLYLIVDDQWQMIGVPLKVDVRAVVDFLNRCGVDVTCSSELSPELRAGLWPPRVFVSMAVMASISLTHSAAILIASAGQGAQQVAKQENEAANNEERRNPDLEKRRKALSQLPKVEPPRPLTPPQERPAAEQETGGEGGGQTTPSFRSTLPAAIALTKQMHTVTHVSSRLLPMYLPSARSVPRER